MISAVEVGLIVGAVLLIVIVILVGCFIRRLKKKRREKNINYVEDNPLYADSTYYEEGSNYTKDRNTYYT